MKNKTKPAIFGVLVVIIGIIIAIIAAVTGGGDSSNSSGKTVKDVDKVLQKSVGKVKLTQNHAGKGTVTYDDSFDAAELPDI